MVSLCTRIGVRIEHTPMTNIRLKILEPMTLLIASSLLCTIEAVTLTAVSGREVPIATIVRPMMIDGTFSFLAMLELPSTKKSAPLIRNTKPTIRNTTTSASGALFIYFSISCSFRFGFEAILSVFIFSFFATYHTTNPYLRKEIDKWVRWNLQCFLNKKINLNLDFIQRWV